MVRWMRQLPSGRRRRMRMTCTRERETSIPPRGRSVPSIWPHSTAVSPKSSVYSEVFEETLLFGDTAVEWGQIEGTERPRGGVEVSRSRVHVMRILRRLPDGSWRIHRTIYAPSASAAPEGR